MVVRILLIIPLLWICRGGALTQVVEATTKTAAEAQLIRQQDWKTPVDRTNSRFLQDGTVTYTARYEAQFQQTRGALCLTTPPTMRVVCNGPASIIQVLNTSDPSIVCSTTAQINEYGETYLACENTCTQENCQDVYEVVGFGLRTSGPFGIIEFQCEAPDVKSVEGSVFVEALENNNCAGDGSVFHNIRLGVYCPNGYGTKYSNESYVYDDIIFECYLGGISQYDEGIYTCARGDSCKDVSCSFSIPEIAVFGDISTYQDECIAPVVPLTLAPTSSPVVAAEPNRFVSSARFEAAWGNLLESSCTSSSPTVLISCLNGEINHVEADSVTVNCSNIGVDAIRCIETYPENIENKFTLVRYNCTARTVPTSSIVFPEQDAHCNGNTRNSTVRHAVQMGVHCVSGDFRFSTDQFLECVDRDHDSDYMNEPLTGFPRFTCSKSATFPIGATPNQSQLIPSVGMVTADAWFDATGIDCSGGLLTTNYTNVPAPMPTKIPFTTAPTIPPETLSPRVTSMPTIIPVQLSTTTPMEPPRSSPELGVAPVAPEATFSPALSSTATTNSTDGSFIDKFVYMLAGGAVVIVVVGFAIVIQRRRAIAPKNEVTQIGGHHPVDPTEYDGVFDVDGDRPSERVANTLNVAAAFREFGAEVPPPVMTHEQCIHYPDISKSCVHFKDQVRENVLTAAATCRAGNKNSEIAESDLESVLLQGHVHKPASLAVSDSVAQGIHIVQTAAREAPATNLHILSVYCPALRRYSSQAHNRQGWTMSVMVQLLKAVTIETFARTRGNPSTLESPLGFVDVFM